MILSSTEELKEYISVSQSFVFEDFKPYINKVANNFTRKYLGDLHEQLSEVITGESEEVKNKARKMLQEVFANFGYYLFLPFATVMMDSSGITVTDNDERKSAEWWQVKDIKRELLRSGHLAMDVLLAYLEAHKDVFPEWDENYGTINRELIINSTSDFDKWFHIYNSRQTFLALQPTIRQVEDQYIKSMLCPELISHLKTGSLEGAFQSLKENLQKAVVCFTVAKVADIGLFVLDDKGLRLDFDSQIDKNRQPIVSGKPTEQLNKFVKEKVSEGSQYLDLAKEVILQNISEFNQCEFPLKSMSNQSGAVSSTYNTRGIFSL